MEWAGETGRGCFAVGECGLGHVVTGEVGLGNGRGRRDVVVRYTWFRQQPGRLWT